MISFRWLGVAGVEITSDDEIILIDPYLTKFSNWFWKLYFGTVNANPKTIQNHIQQCNYILVTHAHWDHFLDVPEIARQTSAVTFGSPNVCDLLRIFEIPEDKIQQVKGNEKLFLGNFEVSVLPTRHPKSSGFGSEWAKGPLRPNIRPPLRLSDYRMDVQYGFLIHVGGISILHWGGLGIPKVQADILFTAPYNYESVDYYKKVLRQIKPQIIVPIHWDAASKPLIGGKVQPTFNTFGDGNPVGKIIDLDRFRTVISNINPEVMFVIPEIFKSISFSDIGLSI